MGWETGALGSLRRKNLTGNKYSVYLGFVYYEKTIWTANRILSQSGIHNHNNGIGSFSRKTHSHYFCWDKVFNMHLSYTELPLGAVDWTPAKSHCGLLPGWEKGWGLDDSEIVVRMISFLKLPFIVSRSYDFFFFFFDLETGSWVGLAALSCVHL